MDLTSPVLTATINGGHSPQRTSFTLQVSFPLKLSKVLPHPDIAELLKVLPPLSSNSGRTKEKRGSKTTPLRREPEEDAPEFQKESMELPAGGEGEEGLDAVDARGRGWRRGRGGEKLAGKLSVTKMVLTARTVGRRAWRGGGGRRRGGARRRRDRRIRGDPAEEGVAWDEDLEANAGALTNFEVLDFLRAKGASKDPTRVIAKVAQSEYKVYDYLVDTAVSNQTRESINEFLTSIKRHDLAKAEVLNILNIRPTADVELFPIIESCEGRFPVDEVTFPDEEVTEILELVTRTLPPPSSMKQEEITKGDEETATLKNENDEVIEDPMDTR
ncbi:hypothetical protein V8G54_020192 [Vigna mungo]|uniref:DNA-directed RNA polymerase III subunit RPC9 n=1 Tax=Vigna mungo TaxID=3915 RepID=A0AAQ3ND72_VIGMU